MEWVAISFSRDQTQISCTAGRLLASEPLGLVLGTKYSSHLIAAVVVGGMQDSCYVFRLPQEIPSGCRMRHLRRQVCLRGQRAAGKYQKLEGVSELDS